jgi:hypothetical protein
MADQSRKKGAGRRDTRHDGLGAGTTAPVTYQHAYGTDVGETVRDKLVAQMESLKAILLVGYNPAISYIYDHHRTALLRTNAVTVDIDRVEAKPTIGGTSQIVLVPMVVTASIRVHLGYTGGYEDPRDAMGLLQSIDNWLQAHRSLGDSYYIESTGPTDPRMSFDESATLGGEIKIVVTKNMGYTQL